MAKLAIWATLEIAQGSIDRYLPIVLAHRERCLRDEPGTLQFDVLRVPGDDTRVMLYELYVDEAAFQVHRSGASVRQHRADAGEMLLKVSGIRHMVVG
jgi:quinol monooxygenase YgiN